MTFTLVDVILILIVAGFVMGGFVMGLIRSIGALVGLVAGTWVAGHYFVPVADWLTPVLMGHAVTAKIVAFMAVFIIINRLAVLVFYLLDRAFQLFTIIPFLGSLNRIGGVLLGAIEGILTCGILIFVVAKIAPEAGIVTDNLAHSIIAHWLVYAATWLTELLPQAFNNIQSIF